MESSLSSSDDFSQYVTVVRAVDLNSRIGNSGSESESDAEKYCHGNVAM
jgi:hypothetical protein